jgi:dTDP-4-amino-4,6-dideoxygalactose transaminase
MIPFEAIAMVDSVDFTDIYVNDTIIERVGEVLRGKRYVKGPELERFEDQFARACGVEHAVGVSNGTAAILLALKSLDIGRGDEIFLPGHTFFATVSPVFALGATPRFVDIDRRTYTMDPEALEAEVARAESPKAILPVHIYGHPADMTVINSIASSYDLHVIEDACQAHLATWEGTSVGALGNIGCFSFYPSKNMTVAGDGGMLVTNDLEVAKSAKQLRNHGRTAGGIHRELGLNYRLDEISAAVGQEQLERLPEWNVGRRNAASEYSQRLQELDEVTTPSEADGAEHVYHLYVVQVTDRDGLIAHLDKHGVETGIHYETPAHRHPAVRHRIEVPTLPITESLCDRIVSLPMHPRLTTEEISYVCKTIEDYYE